MNNNVYSINISAATASELAQKNTIISAFEDAGYAVYAETSGATWVNIYTDTKAVIFSGTEDGTRLWTVDSILALLETGVKEAEPEVQADTCEEEAPEVAPTKVIGVYCIARNYPEVTAGLDAWREKLEAAGYEVADDFDDAWIVFDTNDKVTYSNDVEVGERIFNEDKLNEVLDLKEMEEAAVETLEDDDFDDDFFSEGEADLAEELGDTVDVEPEVAPESPKTYVSIEAPKVTEIDVEAEDFTVSIKTTRNVTTKVSDKSVKIETV